MSAFYLSFLNKQIHAQQLTSKPSFMDKHKITVNQPKQVHYTVEGVQSYAPAEIRALKQKQDKLMQGKDGIYAEAKVFLLSDQVFEEQLPFTKTGIVKGKKKQAKKQQKQVNKKGQRVKMKSEQRVRTNTRNAVSTNNQTLIKLQKNVAKRDELESKLEKMKKKYKQYFKDVDLKQGMDPKNEAENISQDKSVYEDEVQRQTQKDIEWVSGQEIGQKAKNDRSTHYRSSKRGRGIQKQEDFSYAQPQGDQKRQISNKSLNTGFDLIRNSGTYSEKLGTAVWEMFK